LGHDGKKAGRKMVSGIEGVGEAITGGMVARAVEPVAGEASNDGGGNCLNCGAELAGPYCHQCGQQAHVHRSLSAFFHDLLHGVLHFEGKIWRTLPLLAWKPGELTRRYIAGERARFVSPIAMFLFSVFLMFAVFSMLGGPFDVGNVNTNVRAPETRAEVEQSFQRRHQQDMQHLNALRARRAARVAAGRSTASVDADIQRNQQRMERRDQAYRRALSLIAAGTEPREATRTAATETAEADELPTNVGWLNAAYLHAKENPQLLAYKLQTNAYKFSWALIPISVPFVWMLFLHRRRYRRFKAYDHTVFVTYSIASMSLGVIVLSLLRPLGIGEVLIGFAITFLPPIHIYRQLRGAYSLSRFSAIWRTAFLLIFAFVAASLFFALLVALGATH